jgi:hypothetical protein
MGYFVFQDNFLSNNKSENTQIFMGKIILESSAFKNNEMMASKYACDGAGLNPPLTFKNIPAETKSLAITLEDPDTSIGTFDHWVKWNISSSTTEIEEGIPPIGISGKGSSGDLDYIPPCPPTGTHHYIFTIYALDQTLNLAEGSNKKDLLQAMEGHIIDKGQLIGLYEKKIK